MANRKTAAAIAAAVVAGSPLALTGPAEAAPEPASPRAGGTDVPVQSNYLDPSGSGAVAAPGADAAVAGTQARFLERAAARGEVIAASDVHTVRTKAGSLVTLVGDAEVLSTNETVWRKGSGITSESIGVQTSRGDVATFGGGLGFAAELTKQGCNQIRTPAGNHLESCYRKSVVLDDGDNKNNYWSYGHRVTALPDGWSFNNTSFYVKKVYGDSGEAAGSAGSMRRGFNLSPAPGDVVTSNCSDIGVSVPLLGGISASMGVWRMCSTTRAVDVGGWSEATKYASSYDFTSRALDKGEAHTITYMMDAIVTEGVTAYWNDYSQACFSDNFGDSGCATGVEPA